jgi:septin family protein
MPLPLKIAAIGKAISAFAAKNPTVVNQAINTGATLLTNRRNKQTALDFYDRQRADALADWNRQNTYNTPAAQMQRYKDAGLNPHLIYGQTHTAQPIRSVDMKAPEATAPQLNPFAQQQLLNMRMQNQLLQAELENKKMDNDIKQVSMYDMMEYNKQRALLTGYQSQNQLYERYRKEQLLKPQIANILASTNLSNERKAQIASLVENTKASTKLLGERIKTEENQNKFVQQVQALGTGANIAIQLARLIFK